jgi:ATP-binding cassette, subfamily B, bacterial
MIAVFQGQRRKLFVALLAVAVCHSLVAALFSWCIHHLFDGLHVGRAAHHFSGSVLSTAALGTALLAFMFEVVQRRLTEGMGYSYAADVRLALFRHLLRLPTRTVLARQHGALLLPFVGDLTSIRQWVSDGLARSIVATATIVMLLAWLALTSPLLATVLAALLCFFVIVALFLVKPMSRAVRDVRRRRGAVSAFVSGRLAAIATIVSMARQRTEIRKLTDRNDMMTSAALRRAWTVGGMRGLVHLSTSLLVLATLLVGVHEVNNRQMTPGAVVGAISLVALLGGAMRDLGRALELWIPSRIARERITQLMDLPERKVTQHVVPPLGIGFDGLCIDNLSVGNTVKGVCAEAKVGDIILVDGTGDSGKSTLIGAIARLVEPDSGAAVFEGRTLAELTANKFRQTVGFASPLLPLLPGSLDMNVRYRAPQETPRGVTDLLAELGIDLVIGNELQGLDQVLPGKQSELPLCDYQSLTIARAMLGSPPILLLDSIDTHLTPEVKTRLAAKLLSYPGIVIMTATQPELRAIANRIWTIKDGILTQSSAEGGSTSRPLTLVHPTKRADTGHD